MIRPAYEFTYAFIAAYAHDLIVINELQRDCNPMI